MVNPIEVLHKYWKPLAILGVIGAIAYFSRSSDTPVDQPSLQDKSGNGIATSTPSQESEQTPHSTETPPCDGLLYPAMGFCYPYVASLPGEIWDACVSLPPGTTTWGAISATNGRKDIPYDSTRASVIIYDRATNTISNRYDFDPSQDVSKWPNDVRLVPANRTGFTVVCAAEN